MECYCAGAGHTFAACPDPLTVLASMCTGEGAGFPFLLKK
jgi:hypothetical protein